jgi:glycosyltransferase involved in cell wall biosynthesis
MRRAYSGGSPVPPTLDYNRLMAIQSLELAQPARQPQLAVLIPVLNAQCDLEESLLSLTHDGAKFEVFVVDDGSEPKLTVPKGLPFPVHLYHLCRTQGITQALNAGLEQIAATANYSYVARLDAGDFSLPGRFSAQLAFLEAHPDHAVVGTHVEMVDEDGRLIYVFTPPTEHHALLREFRYCNPLSHPSVMMRASALQDCGLYSDAYPGSEDYELWLRFARSWKVANLDEVFVRKKETRSSITSRRLRLRLSRLRIQIDHFAPFSVHAYLGICRSLASMLLSRQMVFRLRRVKTRWAGYRSEC